MPVPGSRSGLARSDRPGCLAALKYPGLVHKTLGQRDPAAAFPLAQARDDAGERLQADHAVAVSAIGLGVTGLGR